MATQIGTRPPRAQSVAAKGWSPVAWWSKMRKEKKVYFCAAARVPGCRFPGMLQGRRPFACALLLALVPYSLTYCSHDDPNGVLPAFGQTCATVVGAFGCAAVFGGTPIGQLCPVTCNNCTCVDDQSGILAGAGQTCAAVVAGLTCQGTVPVLNLPVNTTCGQTCICGGAGGSPANTTSGNCTSNPDSTALSSLYSATNGSGWLNNTGWLQGFACPSNATTESTGAWYGVRCTSCRVSGLFLGQNNLVGTVSAADICSLSAITSLQINTNAISGTIPACVASLIALKSLRLFKNDFSGIAPSTYPPALSELLLHANRLSGFVPDNTSLPLSLQSLLVGDNAMSGVFPAGIERLPALFALDLRNNRLSGTVPTSIGESRSLIMITASGNLFSGHIPAEISKMSILYILLLASNRLSGTLPRELENNQLLSYIDFSDNKISGTIPKEYGNMTQKSLIETVGAALFAECADFLSNFPYSGQLVLHKNSISGTIPPELGNLDNMTLLTLHKNRVSGTIPASLSRVSGMQVLMAHDNNLDGSIPDAFEGLRNLRWVPLARFFPAIKFSNVFLTLTLQLTTLKCIFDPLQVRDAPQQPTQLRPAQYGPAKPRAVDGPSRQLDVGHRPAHSGLGQPGYQGKRTALHNTGPNNRVWGLVGAFGGDFGSLCRVYAAFHVVVSNFHPRNCRRRMGPVSR